MNVNRENDHVADHLRRLPAHPFAFIPRGPQRGATGIPPSTAAMRRALARVATAFAVAGLGTPSHAVGLEPAADLPPAPPALQKALDGVHGKAVIVNFWASWCAPCRDEMPALVELDEAEPGIALVTVAVADRAADTRRFLADFLLEETVVVADPDQAIARAWGARMVPTSYVLDAGHRVRYRVLGETDWRDAALRERLLALTTESKGTKQ